MKQTEQLFTTQFTFSPRWTITELSLWRCAAAGVVAKQEFPRYFMNSLINFGRSDRLAAGRCSCRLCAGTLQLQGQGRPGFFLSLLRFAPELVVIIPLSVLYRQLDSTTPISASSDLSTGALPLLIWVLRSYFEDISPDIEQAAMVDGYSWWQSSSVSCCRWCAQDSCAALLAFVFAWNNFIFRWFWAVPMCKCHRGSARPISSAQAFYNNMAAACHLLRAADHLALRSNAI